MDEIVEIGGEWVLLAKTDGPAVTGPDGVMDLIGEAFSRGVGTVALPVERLDPRFLDLSSRIAGEVIQKFTNYRLRLAIVGDISAELARSEALRAFVIESNRGRSVRFIDRLEGLDGWLGG